MHGQLFRWRPNQPSHVMCYVVFGRPRNVALPLVLLAYPLMPMCFHSMALNWFDLHSWFTDATDKQSQRILISKFVHIRRWSLSYMNSIISAFTVMVSCWSVAVQVSRCRATQVELRDSVLELSAEELVECLAKDLCCGTCETVGLARFAGLVGQASNEN